MQEGKLTAAEVVTVLGMPSTIDPLTFDAFAANVDPAQALAVEKVNHQFMSVVNAFAAAVEGSGASKVDSFNTALNSVVEVMKVNVTDNTTINFADQADLNLIKTQILQDVTNVSNADLVALNSI